MRRIAVLGIALCLFASACSDGGEVTSPTTPGELIVYSGRNENFVQPVVEAFTEATGIRVRVRYGDGTSDLASTILNEGETTNADIFWAQDPAWIGAIGARGLLTGLPGDILSLVAAPYQDANGKWIGVTARSRVFVYNPGLVSADELPATVEELTGPQWRGRVALAPGNAGFVTFVSGMYLSEGEESTLRWLEAMAANDSPTYSGNGAILNAVIAGDVAAGLVNHYYLPMRIAQQGPQDAMNHFMAPGDPGALVMATGVGVLEPSANKEAAFEFIRFLLSMEAQSHFVNNLFEYGLIVGAPTPSGQAALSDLMGPDINQSDMSGVLDSVVTLITRTGLN